MRPILFLEVLTSVACLFLLAPERGQAQDCTNVWFGQVCGDDGNVHVCVAGAESRSIKCPFSRQTPQQETCIYDDWGQAQCKYVEGCTRNLECDQEQPEDVDESCVQPVCIGASGDTNGTCEYPALRARSGCQNGSGICDGSGHCVQCLEDADCQHGDQPYCYKGQCVSG